MAASAPFSEDFVIYKTKLCSLGDWSDGCMRVDDQNLLILTHESVCVFKEQCDPCSSSRRLNILPRFTPFREEEVPSYENEGVGARMKASYPEGTVKRMDLDPCFTKVYPMTYLWMQRHVNNIQRAAVVTFGKDEMVIAILHKYVTVKVYRVMNGRIDMVSDLTDDINSKAGLSKYEKRRLSMRHPEDYDMAEIENSLWSEDLTIFKMSPIDLTWSSVSYSESTRIKYLYVIMKDGSTLVWRVVVEETLNLSIDFCLVIPSSNKKPSCLHYHTIDENSGLLITGYTSGIIEVRLVTVSDDVSVGEPALFWKDVDQLSVNFIREGRGRNEIVFAKENFLLKADLHSVSLFSNFGLLHRFTHTVRGVDVHGGQIIAVSQDLECAIVGPGPCRKPVLADTASEFSLSQCHGALSSRNMAYCAIVTSPSGPRKEKVIRAPFEVRYILLKTNDELISLLCHAMTQPNSQMSDYFDALECLRQRSVVSNKFPSKLLNHAEQTPVTGFKIKLTRFLLKLRCSQWKDSSEVTSWRQRITQCELDLLLTYFNSRKEVFSAGNLETCAGHWFAEMTDCKVAADSVTESCGVCGQTVVFHSPLNAACVNGHQFLRCGHTLQICAEMTHPRCAHCRHPYLQVSDRMDQFTRNLRSNHCTFCEGSILEHT